MLKTFVLLSLGLSILSAQGTSNYNNYGDQFAQDYMSQYVGSSTGGNNYAGNYAGNYGGFYGGSTGPGSTGGTSTGNQQACDSAVDNGNRALSQLVKDLKGQAPQWSVFSDFDAVDEVSYYLKNSCATAPLQLVNTGVTGVDPKQDEACNELLLLCLSILEENTAAGFRGGFEDGIDISRKGLALGTKLGDDCQITLVVTDVVATAEEEDVVVNEEEDLPVGWTNLSSKVTTKQPEEAQPNVTTQDQGSTNQWDQYVKQYAGAYTSQSDQGSGNGDWQQYADQYTGGQGGNAAPQGKAARVLTQAKTSKKQTEVEKPSEDAQTQDSANQWDQYLKQYAGDYTSQSDQGSGNGDWQQYIDQYAEGQGGNATVARTLAQRSPRVRSNAHNHTRRGEPVAPKVAPRSHRAEKPVQVHRQRNESVSHKIAPKSQHTRDNTPSQPQRNEPVTPIHEQPHRTHLRRHHAVEQKAHEAHEAREHQREEESSSNQEKNETITIKVVETREHTTDVYNVVYKSDENGEGDLTVLHTEYNNGGQRVLSGEWENESNEEWSNEEGEEGPSDDDSSDDSSDYDASDFLVQLYSYDGQWQGQSGYYNGGNGNNF